MIKDRYQLEASLEQREFVGQAYRAIDTTAAGNRRYVTLWVLPEGLTASETIYEELKRTFLRVRELVHPGIVRVLELDQDNGTTFVTTEFVDGERLRDLLDLLRPERLDEDEADDVLTQIGAALAYAHERGIAHGDVRLENVTIATDHRCKLSSFFWSQVRRRTPFMPEKVDDVRALAALAYELYTGIPYRPSDGVKRMRELPKRRRNAVESVLTGSAGVLIDDAGSFLTAAGLRSDDRAARQPAHGAAPAPRRRNAPGASAKFLVAGGLAATAIVLAASHESLRGYIEDLIEEPASLEAVASTIATPPSARNSETGVIPRATPASRTIEAAEPGNEVPPISSVADDAAGAGTVPAPPEPALPAPQPDPRPPVLSLSNENVTVYESQTAASIEVLRSGRLDTPVEIVWWTSDGTAAANEDYADLGRRVERLRPGEDSLRLYVPVVCGTRPKHKHFNVHLATDSSSASIGEIAQATVTIIGDDC